MTRIDVFLQGERMKDVLRLQLEPQHMPPDVKRACASRLGIDIDAETLVFLEDDEAPLDEVTTLGSLDGTHGVRLHLHHCRRIAVKVTYSGRTVEHAFGPGTTVGAVKRRAAEKLGIPKDDAAELMLQIAGTREQPDIDMHIGTLAACPACAISFDLVPSPRIQGAA